MYSLFVYLFFCFPWGPRPWRHGRHIMASLKPTVKASRLMKRPRVGTPSHGTKTPCSHYTLATPTPCSINPLSISTPSSLGAPKSKLELVLSLSYINFVTTLLRSHFSTRLRPHSNLLAFSLSLQALEWVLSPPSTAPCSTLPHAGTTPSSTTTTATRSLILTDGE